MDAAHAIPARGGIDARGKALPPTSSKVLIDADLPKALDMTHHLNRLSKNRNPSSLKELYKYV